MYPTIEHLEMHHVRGRNLSVIHILASTSSLISHLYLATNYSSHSRVLNYHRGASRTQLHHIHLDVDVLSADFRWLLTPFHQPTGGKYQFIPTMGAPYRLHVHVAADSHCSASSSVASSLAVLSPTQAGQAGLQAYLLGYSTVSRLSIMLLGIIVRQQHRRHLETDRLPFLRYPTYCHRREAVPASPSQQLSKCRCSLRTCLRSTSLTSTCPDIPPEFDLLRRGTTSGLLDERMLTPTGSLGSANFCNPTCIFCRIRGR